MTDPAPRVIVHAGFHKTGTTSLQAFVERHRRALAPFAAIHVKTDLGAARYLGRWYGQRPGRPAMWLFRLGFWRFVRRMPDAPVHFISRESLSGMMIGFYRGGKPVDGYADTAIPLAQAIIGTLRARFGAGVRIEFLYTLRHSEPFLRSIHGHILRTGPLTDDWETFRARFTDPPDLAAEAVQIAEAIAPVPVHTAWLEEMAQHRLGPGATVLRLLEVPRDQWRKFPPLERHNSGQTDTLRDAFLAMNRAGGNAADLREKKRQLAHRTPPAG